MAIDYNTLPPPQEGNYPDWFKMPDHGNQIEGVVTDTRMGTPKAPGEAAYPILQIQTADGSEHSVGCGAASLYRQVYSLRPQVGQHIRITFQGFSGQAKVFDVQVAGPPIAAPAAVPAPAPAPEPAGFTPPQQAQPAAAPPWGQTPTAPVPQPQPAPNTTAAPPWGA